MRSENHKSNNPGVPRTAALTCLAMVAFASNSVLCRLALEDAHIDAASFSTLRLLSGSLTLYLLVSLSGRNTVARSHGAWISAAMLFLYAIAFSYAYISLTTGVGALILFGSVQATMLLAGLRSGERPHPLQWSGLVLALGGLVYLVLPGLTAPSPAGAALMSVAGFAWGVYSLRGRGSGDPLVATSDNFLRATPMALAVSLVLFASASISTGGAVLAIISGSITSGVGYVIWYAALRGLTATRAAIVQLSVPVLAAFGGVMVLSESVTIRLIVSAIAILGGVALAVLGRERLARAVEASRTT